MMADEKQRNGSVIGGIIVAWLIFALEAGILFALSFRGTIVGMVVGIILLFIISLFIHGVLGFWMIDPMQFAVNKFIRVIFTVIGYIGFFVRPFILMAYGSHKKSILMFCTTLPLAVLSLGIIIINYMLGIGTFLYFIAIIELINCFFLLLIKKCPKCKCVMCKIDTDENFSDEKYYENRSYEVGSVYHDDGSSSKVYAHVKYEKEGKRTTYAKTFTCKNCGTVKTGIKYSVLEDF